MKGHLSECDDKRNDIKEYINLCDEMLFDESFLFACGTIEGIRNYILKYQKITDKQKKALKNIYNSVSDNTDNEYYFDLLNNE